MQYAAYISREGKHVLAEFPDCPGCQTFADSGDELNDVAHEALEGWLEAHLVDGQAPPKPRHRAHAPAGKKLAMISVRAGLATALNIRWERQARGMTQGDLAKLSGVTQQQIAKLEDPDVNPKIETVDRVAKALGRVFSVGFETDHPISVPPPAKRRA